MFSAPARGGRTQFGHDALGRILSVADPRSLSTQYTRNGLGDVTKRVSPDSGTANATYDAAGNLKTYTDARGAKGTYSYDALQRIKNVLYTQSSWKWHLAAGTQEHERVRGRICWKPTAISTTA